MNDLFLYNRWWCKYYVAFELQDHFIGYLKAVVVWKDDFDRFIFGLVVEAGLDQRLALGVVVNFVTFENHIKERRVSINVDCGRQSVAPINCRVARALLNHLFINKSWQVRLLIVIGYINSEFSKLGCVEFSGVN